MELYQLRGFVAVAKLNHLTRAAEKLHLSQPSVSAQIKALEDEFGLALFERTYSGMTLTPAGARLLTDAERILAAAQAMTSLAKVLKGETSGRVRLGTSSDPGFIRVGDFLNAQIERHPLLQVELHQEVTGTAFAKVLEGELDASFYYGDLEHPAMSRLRLRASNYRVVAPAAWSDRVLDASWDQLARQPWVITPSVSSHHKLVRALFNRQGREPTELVEADQESVIANLVASGVGLSLIREDLALKKAAAGEMCLWRDVRLETTLWFIYLLARKDDPVILALLSVLRDIWQLD
jgi:DNA-binding transcriptional LysR family regulator